MLLVVVGHLFRTPTGVFAALDIFFVLSGFLITGLLLDSYDRYGRIHFLPFYLGRARRILPMALMVAVATAGFFAVAFNPVRATAVATDALWASGFAVNWKFASAGTDYFAEQPDSPLLHYWSLAVEEQFYLVWPLMLLVVLTLASRSRSFGGRRALIVALALVTGVSFAYSMMHSAASPNAAYFSTFDRAWEFGVGGLVSAARPTLSRLSRRWSALLAWVGFWSLAFPIFLLDPGVRFPAPWAVPSVLCTAAIIVGGMSKQAPRMPVLENRAMVYVGNISYSVYLWHLPVNVALEYFFDGKNPAYYATALSLTAALSVASYHLVERPMRYAAWLALPAERAVLSAQRSRYRRRRDDWLASSAALTAAVVMVVTVTQPGPSGGANEVPPLVVSPAETASLMVSDLVGRQQYRLTASVTSAAFPRVFEPSLAELGFDKWAATFDDYGCTNVYEHDLESCFFGDPSDQRLAVIVGDSMAMSWMPGLRTALEGAGWKVQQLTYGSCPTWSLASYVELDGEPLRHCATHHMLFERVVRETQPDLVVLANHSGQAANANRDDLTGGVEKVARDGLVGTLDLLSPWASRLAVLGPPPALTDLRDCVGRFTTPQNCATSPSTEYLAMRRGEMAAAEGTTNAEYVDTLPWFCTVSENCPAAVGSTPVTADGSHLSLAYSKELAPLLSGALHLARAE